MQKAFTLLIIVVLLAGCAHKSIPSQNKTANSSLTNTRWKLVAIGMPSTLPPLAKDVFLQMDTGRIKGFAGCNNYFGAYTTKGSSITFTGVGSTKMFCQEGMATENKLFRALEATTHYRITGTRLELLMNNDMVLAAFEALYLQ